MVYFTQAGPTVSRRQRLVVHKELIVRLYSMNLVERYMIGFRLVERYMIGLFRCANVGVKSQKS